MELGTCVLWPAREPLRAQGGYRQARHIYPRRKNGILLDAVLENSELLTAFEVEGRLLLTCYTLVTSGIRYETRTFQRGELGPHKVASWKSQSLQNALLKRSD